MGTIIKTIGPTANIRVSEGAGTTTLTSADNPCQVFNLSASRTVVLPTTNIKAGDTWVLENQGAFAGGIGLTVQASGGLAMTLANGANLEASFGKGHVTLEALINTPTTPAHWRVVDVSDRSHYTTTYSFDGGGGTSAARSVALYRHNNHVTVHIDTLGSTTTGTGSVRLASNTAMPVRFRPDQSNVGVVSVPYPTQTNGVIDTAVVGMVTISAVGALAIYKNMSGAGTFTNAQANSGFAQFGDGVTITYINGIGG